MCEYVCVYVYVCVCVCVFVNVCSFACLGQPLVVLGVLANGRAIHVEKQEMNLTMITNMIFVSMINQKITQELLIY